VARLVLWDALEDDMTEKKRWGALGIAVLLAGAWFGLSRERQAKSAPAVQSNAQLGRAPEETLVSRRAAGSSATARSVTKLEDAIEIESVEVDKSEVCKGEEVIVRVKAKSLDGEDADLTYGVAGQPRLVGPTFTLRPEESIGIDWLKVFVRGRRGTHELRSVPPVLVKDCLAPAQLHVQQLRDADRPDQAQLHAEITVPEGEGAFQPVSFDWDFGDGTRLQTSETSVAHSYEGRLQTTNHSYFLVSVTARDAEGHSTRGSRSLRFVNLGYHSWRSDKRVVVYAGFGPGETAGSERTWLYHGAPVSITLDSVTVSDVETGDAGEQLHENERVYSPSALFGFSELPAGKSLTTRDLGALRPTEPGATRLVELRGHGPGTVKADAAFVLRGPSLPEEPATESVAHDSGTSLESEPVVEGL
jgi:hypothetical protein